ncbi:nuclear transport factor 2 family protein [Pseudidiomarina sp. 1APP75-27a]|uniref:nuclear transport factor 2 family protein n=1 Tax=Pseudidiomarina terrestris TaxID=2820060 RepID=UPI002B05B158|nr:nuclear transport factor 2 family protein [Pseudidiomarina sp. 1APP75-27a]MEA3588497.1 nuclear transport factor 2 family protein [Pseudidiomarina sp. 1APP75-27a]
MANPLELTQGIYRAFAQGDIPSVLDVFAPTINWIEAEGGPYGGIFNGPDAVLENVFIKLGGEWDDFSAVPHEFIVEGSKVVALGVYSGSFKATGKSFTAPFAHIWKFEDGQAISFQQYTDTALHQRPLL